MGILLGLLTAISWGTSDLLARFAAQKIGALRAMLYMQLIGFLLLTLALHWLGGFGRLSLAFGAKPWAWGLCAGVLNAAATFALYRSFEIGKISVVAPISATYPALTMLLAALTGERLTALRLAGLALILAGVVIVARGEEPPSNANPVDPHSQLHKRNLGVGWAIASAIGFGLLFWVLGIRAVPLLGGAQTVWVVRLTCVVLAGVVVLIQPRRNPSPIPETKWPLSYLLGMGLLDTGAYVLNNYGMRLEQVSVVTVLSSLYGAVTVALAATILHERITRIQWLGVASIFAGIAVVAR